MAPAQWQGVGRKEFSRLVLAMLAKKPSARPAMSAVGVAVWEVRPFFWQVTWRTDSAPTGAAIIGPSEQILGQTPLRLQQKRNAGKVELTIRLPGCQDAKIFLDCDANFAEIVRLEPKR